MPPATQQRRLSGPPVVVAALALVAALLTPAPAAAQEPPVGVTADRVAGGDRFGTAAEVATATFEQASVVHLATGARYPDALAASFAAGAVDGPILLTEPNTVPPATLAALDTLGAQQVVLVGGPGAITPAVGEQLIAAGYDVDRVEGADRFQTASAVAMRYGEAVGTYQGERTALVASGEDFPDALTAGPLSAAQRWPLFLTPTDRTEFSVNTSLEQLAIDLVIIVGGEQAVSRSVQDEFEDRGLIVLRIGGQDRTDTANSVAAFAEEQIGWDYGTLLLARGDNYPDALTAAPHGAALQAPILLTEDPGDLGPRTADFLRGACAEVEVLRAIGGELAISAPVLAEAVATARECLITEEGQTFIVAPQVPLQLDAGQAETYSVPGRYDGEPFEGPVELALFPCESVEAIATPKVFTDLQGDGVADFLGETDTGNAELTAINGIEFSGTQAREVVPGGDGVLTFTVSSDAPDCTVPVVWEDVSGDVTLRVDADGLPTEPFGLGQIGWHG